MKPTETADTTVILGTVVLNDRETGLPIKPSAGHATYPGDCRGILGEVMGPNLLREYLVAVETSYDSAADRTRVGFAYLGQMPR